VPTVFVGTLAAGQHEQLLAGDRPGPLARAGGVPADVRGEQQAGRVPQRVLGGQRLRLGDVEPREQPPGLQLDEQGVGVHDLAAGGVDQGCAVLHPGQERRVDQPAGGLRQGHDEDDRVGVGQQVRQLVDAPHVVARPPGHQRDGAAEPVEPPAGLLAQVARARRRPRGRPAGRGSRPRSSRAGPAAGRSPGCRGAARGAP
jgi:hypothetical protein